VSLPVPVGSRLVTTCVAPVGVARRAPAGWTGVDRPARVAHNRALARQPWTWVATPWQAFPATSAPGTGWSLARAVARRSCFGGVVCLEERWEWVAGDGAVVEASSLQAHWSSITRAHTDGEPGVVDADEASAWHFPVCTLMPGEMLDEQARAVWAALVRDATTAVRNEPATLEDPVLVAAMSWDVAFCLLHSADSETEEMLPFLVLLASVDWHAHERAIWDTRATLAEPMDARDTLRRLRDAQRTYVSALVASEPFDYCWQESDAAFIRTLFDAWAREELHARTTGMLEHADRLAVDAQEQVEREEEAVRAWQQGYLNWLVTVMGALGAAGTVAGIMSAVDFRAAFLDEWSRVLAVGASTLLVIAFLFVPLLRRK
jgi:hypothetical protein